MIIQPYKQKPPTGVQLRPDNHWSKRGLVGCWLMNEGSGDKVFDSSGYDSPSSFDGSWSRNTAYFDGSQKVVTRDIDEPSTQITVCAWIYINTSASIYESGIVSKPYSSSGPYISYKLTPSTIPQSLVPGFKVGTDSDEDYGSAESSGAIQNYTWHFMVGTWTSGDSVKLYVDGVLVNSGTVLGGSILHSTTYDQCIGFDDLDNEYFIGWIDLPLIYNRALTASEIASLYANPYQMFVREPIVVLAPAAGSTSASADDISHIHNLDTTTVEQTHYVLAPVDISHSHSLDTATVEHNYELTTQDINHSHALDTTTVDLNYELTVQDIAHSHSLDTTALTQNNVLSPVDISHTHSLDVTTIEHGYELTTQDISHTHSLDTTTVTTAVTLTAQDIAHTHSLDTTSVVSAGVLSPADISHTHSLDAVTLIQANIISPVDISHTHSLDTTVVVSEGILDVQDLSHTHSLDTTTLDQTHYLLSPNDLSHTHSLDTTTAGKLLEPADISHTHSLDTTTVVQTHYILATQDISHTHSLHGDEYKAKYPPVHSDTYVKATTKNAGLLLEAYYATDPTLSKTGTLLNTSWSSDNNEDTNQRFHIDLGSAKVIKRIYLENFHSFGFASGTSVKNFTFWGSNNAAAFADLTYANDANWTQLTTDISIWDAHVAMDIVDPQYALVTNDVAYRYYAFKFADNYGESEMGVRHVELQGDRLALTQHYTLAISDLAHSHSLDTTTADVSYELTAQDISHTHSLDTTTVDVASSELTVQDISHSHSLDGTTLDQTNVVAPEDISHTHSLDTTTLTTGIIDPDDISHTHSLDTTTVVVGGTYLRGFTDGYSKSFYFEGEDKDFYFEGESKDFYFY